MEISQLLIFFLVLNILIMIPFIFVLKHTEKQSKKAFTAGKCDEEAMLKLTNWILENPNIQVMDSHEGRLLLKERVRTYEDYLKILNIKNVECLKFLEKMKSCLG